MIKRREKGWFRVAVPVALLLCTAIPAFASQTTITVGGAEHFALPTTWDSGTLTLTADGYSETIGYGQFSTPQSVASGLAAKFSLDCNSPVIAKATGASITFITKQADETDAIDLTATWNTSSFQTASFYLVTPSQSPAPGVTPSVSVACTPDPVPMGGSADCTAQLPAGATGTVSFSFDGQSAWSTATLSNGGWATASTLSGLQTGSHTVTASYSGNATYNATNQTASIAVEGGTTLTSSTVYSYSITQSDGITSGYAANGNVTAYIDSVNGAWSSIGYDGLNRLTGATATSVSGATQNWCWTYDSFGNRTLEATSLSQFGSSCSNSGPVAANPASYRPGNQIVGLLYDTPNPTNPSDPTQNVGNVQFDGTNTYLYDGDGRVCAVANRPFSGGVQMTQYIYDADGNRVAKGTISTFSCDNTINSSTGLPNNGFQPTNSYALGPNNEQVTEMTVVSGQTVWAHTNVYAGGMLLATYDSQGLHFQLTDWLGSRRVQTNAFGEIEETCANSPYGNNLNCAYPSGAPTTADDATEHHFTGKERDAESGLDYFGARYYPSSMGRFMSPDSAAIPDTVPYADFGDPQSLNLYAYARNNPIRLADPDGHQYTVCDQNGNCNHQDDGTFEQAEKGSRIAGDTYSNGTITLADGSAGGTYHWDGPDMAGDPAANIAAAGQIARDGNGAINFMLQNMAIQVGTAGLGVAAEAGADAFQAWRAAQVMGRVAAAGRAGEAAVSAIEDIGVKKAIQVGGKTFIPDGMTSTTLNEVKNVANLSYTAQLRAFAQYAGANKLTFQLWVRSSTVLSGPLQDAVSAGTIALRTIP